MLQIKDCGRTAGIMAFAEAGMQTDLSAIYEVKGIEMVTRKYRLYEMKFHLCFRQLQMQSMV